MAGTLQKLKDIFGEIEDTTRAAGVLAWDQETYMPPGGVEGRASQLSTLSRLAHARFISDEVGLLLDAAEDEVSGLPFDSDDASLVRVARRDYEQERKLPSDLVAEIARARSTAQPIWQKARKDSDFKAFAPYLEKNVDLCRRGGR